MQTAVKHKSEIWLYCTVVWKPVMRPGLVSDVCIPVWLIVQNFKFEAHSFANQ